MKKEIELLETVKRKVEIEFPYIIKETYLPEGDINYIYIDIEGTMNEISLDAKEGIHSVESRKDSHAWIDTDIPFKDDTCIKEYTSITEWNEAVEKALVFIQTLRILP